MTRPTRALLLLVFATLAMSILVGVHYYVASRLLLEPATSEPWRTLGLALVVVGGIAMVAQPAAERLLDRRTARLTAWPAALWMGLLFLLVVLLGLSDLVLWSVSAGSSGDAWAMGDTSRRAAVLLLAGVAGAYGLWSGLSYPAVRRVEVRLPRWPSALDGFRIVQISDIHIGPLLDRTFASEVTRRVNALAPDLVAITGDLVDGPVKHVGPEVEPFRELRARRGVFFVTGNHDHMSKADEWSRRVAELGVTVLRNERLPIDEAGAGFDLVGVDDHRGDLVGGEGGEDLERALGGRDGSRFALLLAHDPTTFTKAARMGVDLQLSGHTHGGQIWPFALAVRLVVPYVAGLYRVGGAQLYVSRGTGFWGPPIRLLAPAEITELVLRAGS